MHRWKIAGSARESGPRARDAKRQRPKSDRAEGHSLHPSLDPVQIRSKAALPLGATDLERQDDLHNVKAGVCFRKAAAVALQMREEFATVDIVKDNVQLGVVLKGVV